MCVCIYIYIYILKKKQKSMFKLILGISVDQPTSWLSQLIINLGMGSHSYEHGNVFFSLDVNLKS